MQIHYDPTNKPFRVQRGSHKTEFWYGTDDQRYFQRDSNAGDTIYIGKLFEQKSTCDYGDRLKNNVSRWLWSLGVPSFPPSFPPELSSELSDA